MLQILRRTLAHYFVHLIIFGGFLLIYNFHSYYLNLLSESTVAVFRNLFFGYLVLGLPYYFFRFRFFCSAEEYSKDKLVVLRDFIFRRKRDPATRAAAKTVALSYLVKFFFLPLMLNFFFAHLRSFLNLWRVADPSQNFPQFFWQSGYHLIFQSIFIIDAIVFAFAYTFEFRFLKNKIRSVDPFLSGWIIALICYPPFNSAIDNFIPLTKNASWFVDGWFSDLLKIGTLVAFAIYVWATIALGFKASNLTNRGIVSTGPYRFVRHPAYISKNIAWWFEFIPFLSPVLFISLLGWNAIYILRAFTEERHLRADPDYREYEERVKWRFIPGLF